MNNYYDILGVSKGASKDEIKRAYRKLSKKHHPDVNGGNDDKFKQINEAYDILSDDSKRRNYDNPRSNFEDLFGSGFRNWGAEDIFNDFFNGGYSHHKTRGSDIKVDLSITVKDSLLGGDKEISYYRLTPSMTEELRSLKIKIPVGADDGMMFRIQGGGHYGNRVPGDLIIIINIVSDGKFDKQGPNLIYYLELNPIEILTGKEEIIDLYTSKLKVRIPECVNVNQPMRVRGKGFKTGRGVGDLFINFRVKTPKTLTDYELRLIEELKKGDNFRN